MDETPKAPADPIDTRLVRRLAAILKETDLTEIEIEKGDLKIRVARGSTMAAGAVHYAAAPAPAPVAAAMPEDPAAPPTAAERRAAQGEAVKSPMVGTVYHQAQPGADPFVKPGTRVTAGQTLLIIEAMKTMNAIPSPRDGVVLEVLIGDGEPVEFGAPLVILE